MKKVCLAVAVCSLVAGGIAGFYIERTRYAHTVSNMIVSDEFGRAADAFTTLHDLREGDTNAVFDQLEEEIDVGAASLFAIVEENPSIEHGKNYQNFLRRIADYRTKYPHRNNDTNMDSMVTAALTKAANENASK
ncbi:MAG: hypothetical protein ABSG87_05450 [Verrucomicrobiota bacterium]|jgi:hypothetical protein